MIMRRAMATTLAALTVPVALALGAAPAAAVPAVHAPGVEVGGEAAQLPIPIPIPVPVPLSSAEGKPQTCEQSAAAGEQSSARSRADEDFGVDDEEGLPLAKPDANSTGTGEQSAPPPVLRAEEDRPARSERAQYGTSESDSTCPGVEEGASPSADTPSVGTADTKRPPAAEEESSQSARSDETGAQKPLPLLTGTDSEQRSAEN
ncbi:hypothetical protein [Nocardia sp. NPDC050435]|uniref:hypothetical protein n=1 Tax=Nocardia sp. NPDC050435 TaxID=3155040 RepID=UPI0033DFC4BE